MQLIPELVSYALIVVFSEVLAVAFAGVKPGRKNNILQIAAVVFLEVLPPGVWFLFGLNNLEKAYPILIHLPLICILVLVFHVPFFKSVTCVLVAYLCCHIPQLFGMVILILTGNLLLRYAVCCIATIVTLIFLLRYIAEPVSNLLEYSRSTLLFCLTLPSIFYIFGYTTVFNTNLFHPDTKYMVQLLFSCASIFYFLFLITYCHELSYRKNAELENHLLTIQTQQALKNLENYQKVSQQAAVSLHDQRHHLALLYGFLQEGRTDRAMDYIRKVMQTFHTITPPQTYCRNSTVNLLLAYFEENASSGDVDFRVEAALPPKLSVSETDLCVLLSNILENAVKAAAEVGDEDKSFVRIRCHLAKGNLVLLVENSYVNEVILKDGVPCCTEYGHGFGTKSIVRLAEKYHGYCSFQTEGRVFTVKIVLPCREAA